MRYHLVQALTILLIITLKKKKRRTLNDLLASTSLVAVTGVHHHAQVLFCCGSKCCGSEGDTSPTEVLLLGSQGNVSPTKVGEGQVGGGLPRQSSAPCENVTAWLLEVSWQLGARECHKVTLPNKPYTRDWVYIVSIGRVAVSAPGRSRRELSRRLRGVRGGTVEISRMRTGWISSPDLEGAQGLVDLPVQDW